MWPEPPPTGDVDQALVDQVLVDEAEQETEVVTTRRDYRWCGSSLGWVGRGQVQPLEGGQTLVDPSEGDLDGAEAVVQSANVAPDLANVAPEFSMATGDLHAQGDDRGDDGSDDPLRVSAGHVGRVPQTAGGR